MVVAGLVEARNCGGFVTGERQDSGVIRLCHGFVGTCRPRLQRLDSIVKVRACGSFPALTFSGFFVTDWLEGRASVAGGGRCAGGIVLIRVFTAAQVGLEIGIYGHVVLHVGAGIANREARSSPIGRVGG